MNAQMYLRKGSAVLMQTKAVYRKIERPAPSVIEALSKLDVASLHESMTHDTLLDHEIRSIVPGIRRVGPAITALNVPGDNLAMHTALSLAEPGDFLVIGACPGDAATWGGLTSEYAIVRGLAGVIADGSVRDVARIRELGLGVWARRILSRHGSKESVVGVNVPVICGGVIVHPGDIIAADDDGVIALPRLDVDEIRSLAESRIEKENQLLPRISAGESPFEIYEMEPVLAAANVPVFDCAYGECSAT